MQVAMQSKALPSAWVERLFARFSTMYGSKLASLWEGSDIDAVKADWAHDLRMFGGSQILWAIEQCKETHKFPPTSPEFYILCKQAPRPELPALPEPKIDPELAEARAKEIAETVTAKLRQASDHDWAVKILENVAQGVVYQAISEQFAVEALKNLGKLDEAPKAYTDMNRVAWQHRRAA